MSLNKAKLASALFGLGAGGGQLQKLTITYEHHSTRRHGSVEALFNPNEINLSRSVSWEQQRVASQGGSGSSSMQQEFRAIEAETFSIELFFDTYEARSSGMTLRSAATALLPTNPFQSRDATDVRRHTDKIAALAEVDRELHRPPVCHLQWGAFDIFTGVLASLAQRFTMFLEDGTPVRATVTCSFVEARPGAQVRTKELFSADVTKTRQVRRNDTLHSLAWQEYNDPGLWRQIARANGIVNPRDLKPGTVLTIPKLP